MHRRTPVVAVLLAIGCCSGQTAFAANLFTPGTVVEADLLSGKVNEFTPGIGESTFASGLNHPTFLTFNSSGDLFRALVNNNNQAPG